MLNVRLSNDPTEVLEEYRSAVVLIREWSWTIPHTSGGILRGVSFDTNLGVAVLNYDSPMYGSRKQTVSLTDVKSAGWNRAETEFTFEDRDGTTVTIVPIN